MSRLLNRHEYREPIKNGALVNFYHEGKFLEGTVVRVDNSLRYYHVQVDQNRYEVDLHDDNLVVLAQ